MKKSTWRKYHKWLGLGMTLFMLMFCVSGVLLNHRSLIKSVNVSRKYLPSRYEYHDWNGGLLRGTTDVGNLPQFFSPDSADLCRHLLIYGSGGIWITDEKASSFRDFNMGLPEGADYRQIRNVVRIDKKDNGANNSAGGSVNTDKSVNTDYSGNTDEYENTIFAVSPFALYRYGIHGAWHEVKMPLDEEERLTDVASHGDTLVVLSRSFAYTSLPPYTTFHRIELPEPKGYDGRVTAFRALWLLHSGELFGMAGRLVVDAVAIVLVVLCVTGFIFWLRPKRKALLKTSLQIHDRVGRYTIVVTLLVALTGWCLRPPVMIALVQNKISAIPGTALKNHNPWNDKLRMVRFDEACGDWLLSTSDGFYSLDIKRQTMVKIDAAPPVSVMGLNVLQKNKSGKWYCGSFCGLYVWDRRHATSIDYFTNEQAPAEVGPPFGKKAIAGMSQDFGTPVIAEYYDGTPFAPQPSALTHLPMSLWNVALEVHSGRMFIGSIATYVFIFVMGILAIWCLWSGYKVRRRKRK